MKRFYKDVSTQPEESGWQLHLDGKLVKTPAKRPLVIASAALAEAIAEEWRVQGETILPLTMPLTQLANAAADLGEADRERVADHLAGYAATELLCYREPRASPLQRAQADEWERWLSWAEQRFDVRFRRAEGIMPVAQPPETLQRMRQIVMAQETNHLVALNTLTGALGSLLLALAVMDKALDGIAAQRIARLEHLHQEQTWGTDAEAARAEARLQAEVTAAERFIRLAEHSL